MRQMSKRLKDALARGLRSGSLDRCVQRCRRTLSIGGSLALLGCGTSAAPALDGGHPVSVDGAIVDGGARGAKDAEPASDDASPNGSDARPDGSTGSLEVACRPSTIALRGVIDGNALARDYKIINRFVTDEFSSHELPDWGRVSIGWQVKLLTGQTADEVTAEVALPFSDPTAPGRIFCSTTASTTRSEERYEHHIAQLAEARCPGEPVAGALTVTPTRLTGTVDGMPVDEAVPRIQEATPRFRVLGKYEVVLLSNVLQPDAQTGEIVSGTFVLNDEVRYCVGGGTFTRQASGSESSVTMTLTNLSRLPACADLPKVGEMKICIADPWQLERP